MTEISVSRTDRIAVATTALRAIHREVMKTRAEFCFALKLLINAVFFDVLELEQVVGAQITFKVTQGHHHRCQRQECVRLPVNALISC